MGKHDKKTGKGRLDKFYKLAKEQGYRARSAFKLVHLNRKYDLLAKSKCCIDLCAAPGGWLQVAEKYMPKGSLIVGVDLNPIKPLPHVSTFVADITTPQCRQQLRAHLHDWKADLVLHDGAPNVGSAWVQDAFTQNELVLQSLKLATEFLGKGGHFVTKVFRSQDYNALMWVFQQLFKSVEATKPPSSRNVSAEIFVVCQNFIAPKHIDPKFLDPKHVFKDAAPLPTSIIHPSASSEAGPSTAATSSSLSASANAVAKSQSGSNAHANVFMPEKKRRHREGYAEGEFTNFHAATATDFIRGVDAVGLLGTMNKIGFVTEEEKQWLKSRHTTPAVIASCEDLKVLGKSDFKQLMKWRLAIRLEIGLDVKAETTQDATEEITVEPMDEEQQISEELTRLQEAKTSRQKREKKRSNEKKARELLKLQLNMTAPEDLDNDDRGLAGEETFDLGEAEIEASRRGKKRGVDDIIADQDGMDESASESSEEEDEDEVFDSDEERELRLGALEGELDGMYDDYTTRMAERDAKYKVKQARLKDKNYDAWHGIKGKGDGGSDSESDGDDGVRKGWKDQIVRQPRRGDAAEDEEEEEDNTPGGWDVKQASKAKIGEESDSDSDEDDNDGDRRPTKKVKKENIDKKVSFAASKEEKRQRGKFVTSLAEPEERKQMSRQAQLWFDQKVFKGVGDLAALDGDEEDSDDEVDVKSEEEDSEAEEEEDVEMEVGSEQSSTAEDEPATDDADQDDDTFEIVPQAAEDNGPEWDVDDEDQDEVKAATIRQKGLLTAEAVTLATQLVNRQITADQLIDDGFNRLSTHHKDGLPTWFLDDEAKHYKANIPVTKEAVQALRDKQRALDARPIKKVAEAKARKKYKAVQRLEKAKKKAAGVMEAEDLSMGEKAKAVMKAMGKGRGGAEKKPEKKVVVARGANKGIQGRPKGVKGRYKIVDARMRKEVRAQKRIKKATKKR